MDQFEDQFLADTPETLGLNFEDEAKFFDPEAAHEADTLGIPRRAEESIYTDDPVRVYLREMGAVLFAYARRRSGSGAPHGAWEVTDAKGDQPLRPGAGGGCRTVWSGKLKKGAVELE